MRVVFDTNVLFSAFTSAGLCHQIYERALLEAEPVTSDDLVSELRDALSEKTRLESQLIADICEAVAEEAEIVTPAPLGERVCRDKADDVVLATAVTGHADCIVTGDDDLLVLKKHGGIRIPLAAPVFGIARPETMSERTGEMASGWRRVRLGDVCELNPRRSQISRPDDALTTFLPMPAIGEGGVGIKRAEVRPFRELRKGYTSFVEGDVLFAKITPCMQNAKHAIARNLTDGIGFGSTEFHVLRPRDEIISETSVSTAWLTQRRATAALRFTASFSKQARRAERPAIDEPS